MTVQPTGKRWKRGSGKLLLFPFSNRRKLFEYYFKSNFQFIFEDRNTQVPQSREDDSDSVHSVVSLVSTESQRRRRLVQAESPSKKAVELVTVQGHFAEVIYDLQHIGKADFLYVTETVPLKYRQDGIFGEWFTKNITLVHQQNLRPGLWIFQFDTTFNDTLYMLYTAIERILCVIEASQMHFK